MISYSTIKHIQSEAQIFEVVSDFIALQKRGVNYVGLCPFHEDNNPSFYVSPSKNIYKCFSCGEGGTPIHFVMKHEQFSYLEALKYLAKKYSITIHELDKNNEQIQIQDTYKSMFILNDFAQKEFSYNLFETEEGKLIGLSFLKKRNFKETVIRKFQLGYADSKHNSFSQKALKIGYKQECLEKIGLSVMNKNSCFIDRFRKRAIFPIHTLSGKIVAFGGRILKKERKEAKYINSPESEIYCKSNELYGIYFARKEIVKQNHCYLVEGYSDVISMFQLGIENVVSSCGTALTKEQIQLIRRFTENVTILYDSDIAGIKGASRSIDLLLKASLNIKIVLLPKNEDPDSFIQKQSASLFKDYIKNNEIDFIQFKITPLINDVKNDPVLKAHIITEIINTIALIPKEIIRLMYIKKCSCLFGIDERILIYNVTNKRQKIFLKKKKNTELQFKVAKHQNIYNSISCINQNLNNSTFYEYEKEIMYYVIRYGEQYFHHEYIDEKTNNSESINVNVIEFIIFDLKKDKIELHHPLYKKILKIGYTKWKEGNFVAENYFKYHPDIEISHFAADISTDKYIESQIYSKYNEIEFDDECVKITKQMKKNKMLLKEVPYVVLNYKNLILKYYTEIINKQIKLAEQENNFDKQMELIQQLNKLLKPKKNIAMLLHNRIITNYNGEVFTSMSTFNNSAVIDTKYIQ